MRVFARSEQTSAIDILHLDPTRFRVSTLGSHTLHEHHRSEQEILQSIGALWLERLDGRRHELTAQEFVDQHWPVCEWFDQAELLRDMPLSGTMVTVPESPVCLIPAHRAEPRAWPNLSLPDRKSVFIQELPDDYGEDEQSPMVPLASVYAVARGLPILRSTVPSTHWASQRAVNLLSPTLGLRYELQGARKPASFNLEEYSFDVQLCESYTIHFAPSHDYPFSSELLDQLQPIAVTDLPFYDNRSQTIIVPDQCQFPGRALQQISSYDTQPRTEEFSCRSYKGDYDALERFVVGLRATPAEAYLLSVLESIPLDSRVLGAETFRMTYCRGDGWRIGAF